MSNILRNNPEIPHVPVEAVTVLPIQHTSNNGVTAGLEDQLVIEALRRSNVTGFREELSSIKDAYSLAAELHVDDVRAGEPYINHLLKTAIRGLSRKQLGVADPQLVKALLLHDSVVKHPNELANVGPEVSEERSRALALETIRDRFGGSTEQIIIGLTTHLPSLDIDHFGSDIGHADGLFRYGQLIARVGAIAEFTEDVVDLLGDGDKMTPDKDYLYLVRKANSYLPIIRTALLKDNEMPTNDLAQFYAADKMPLDDAAREYVAKDLDTAENQIHTILAA